jgi:hypothetical protein
MDRKPTLLDESGRTHVKAVANGCEPFSGRRHCCPYLLPVLKIRVSTIYGDGTFRTALPLPITNVPYYTGAGTAVAAGDLNGDGKLDVVIYSGNATNLLVMLGNGDGTFQAPTSITLSQGDAQTLTIVDLNGDGKQDLLLGSCCGDVQASYLLGHGDGTFGPQVPFISGPNPGSIAVADFSGPGISGLAIAGYTGLAGVTDTVAVLNLIFPACDVNQAGTTNVADVQTVINEALGLSPPLNDLSGDGVVNVLDIETVVNAALGLGCSAQ